MGERYIFTIERLTKTYGKKEVLKDINLAFYPGAKIGVIGPNGSGKSSLLRVMALVDKDFMGEAFAGQEAGRQIGAQQGEAEYNDFLRMLNAASGVSTGILGQFPLAASSKSTGSQGQIGIK